MLNSENIKLLDNYQLYELIHGKSVDKEMVVLLKEEYQNRNLSTNEQIRLKQKYDVVHATYDKEIEKNNWNPLFSHYKHIFNIWQNYKFIVVKKKHGFLCGNYILDYFLKLNCCLRFCICLGKCEI